MRPSLQLIAIIGASITATTLMVAILLISAARDGDCASHPPVYLGHILLGGCEIAPQKN